MKRPHALQRSHRQVEHETDSSNQHHPGHDQIVSVPRIARVHNQKASPEFTEIISAATTTSHAMPRVSLNPVSNCGITADTERATQMRSNSIQNFCPHSRIPPECYGPRSSPVTVAGKSTDKDQENGRQVAHTKPENRKGIHASGEMGRNSCTSDRRPFGHADASQA